jgi:hypothetical protein
VILGDGELRDSLIGDRTPPVLSRFSSDAQCDPYQMCISAITEILINVRPWFTFSIPVGLGRLPLAPV